MTASSSLEDREIPTVREDPDLVPLEKETSIHFSKGDDAADVFTAERGLTRRLLAHELFTIDTILLKDGSRSDSIQSLDASEDVVVGVQGTLPIGCLKVRASARGDNYGHARVVSTADTVADAGGGGGDE